VPLASERFRVLVLAVCYVEQSRSPRRTEETGDDADFE
jgi:hypothetical protein